MLCIALALCKGNPEFSAVEVENKRKVFKGGLSVCKQERVRVYGRGQILAISAGGVRREKKGPQNVNSHPWETIQLTFSVAIHY